MRDEFESLPEPLPTGATNELAKERNRAAAERTLTSWIQNCLALIGFGIAFDRIFNAINQSFPNNDPIFNTTLTTLIGLSAIVAGIVLLILAIVSYLQQIQHLEHAIFPYRSPQSRLLLTVTTTSVVLFGMITIVAVLITLTTQ
jgi:putative membrane protein